MFLILCLKKLRAQAPSDQRSEVTSLNPFRTA